MKSPFEKPHGQPCVAIDPTGHYHSAMRLSLVQMTATNDLDTNLQTMRNFVEQAHQEKADIVVFPEMAYFIGHSEDCSAVLPKYDATLKTFSKWAKEFSMEIIPGSLREPIPKLPCRQFNTLPYIDATGNILAFYRKLFLFRAELPDRVYDETLFYDAGKELVTLQRPWGRAGLAICFDIRFPELFRALRKRGMQVLFVPAAFAVPTGKVHWHTLLKARAIENQCFVVAPALTGRCGDERLTYGHSLIVSPWGEVLTEMGEEVGLVTHDISLDDIGKCQKRLDAWACRRDDLFPTP
ncbi:MAG: carbon-nitrogen hydrolase family protein [Bdellovibrionales bacterium]|nr:carbon-nitrogen hydrolase family protein [Bdellovibrionales bacterium]